jgi:lipoyl(octanoyl) transferase
MAVDEWLLQTVKRPTLRVYAWDGLWASVGYFGDLDRERERISGRQWVRRWTGGGTVDHAKDWTYTVVVPVQDPCARMRGGESYRWLHQALAQALEAEGVVAEWSSRDGDPEQTLCFQNPVLHDLLTDGHKLAGAGQRRTKCGILHQGSVAGLCVGRASRARAEALAGCLCEDPHEVYFHPAAGEIEPLVRRRYRGMAEGEF